MPLFLVCGTSATGKSQVCRVLKERGYEAYDADQGLARWQHKQTGYVHPPMPLTPEQRTPEFLAEHEWNIPWPQADGLARQAHDKPIFLCGSLANEDRLYDLCDKVFALYVDDDTLMHRLATRTTNDWGKQPHELRQTLDHHHKVYKKYAQRGYSIIDATQTIDRVVDNILAAAGFDVGTAEESSAVKT